MVSQEDCNNTAMILRGMAEDAKRNPEDYTPDRVNGLCFRVAIVAAQMQLLCRNHQCSEDQ